MEIVKRFSVDLALRNGTPVVEVMEQDSARWLEITLLSENRPWQIPENISVLIRYAKPDGTTGLYDTLPDDNVAWQACNNLLKIALAPQTCTAAGAVLMQVVLVQGTHQISTFPFVLQVGNLLTGEEDSKDYTNLAAWLAEFGGNGGYAHVANTSNPHKVTKTQVGLGNADNTADTDKEVKYANSAGALSAVELTNIDILEYAAACPIGETIVTTGSGVTNLPSGSSNIGVAIIDVRDKSALSIQYKVSSEGATYINYKSGANWSGWKHLISSTDLVDYVVASGTSGIWTFRIWNNGMVQCWGELGFTNTTAHINGSLYMSDIVYSQPYPLSFISPPFEFIHIHNGGWVGYTGKNTSSATSAFNVFSSKTEDITKDLIANYYVIGRWK